ncbi:MAG: VOC family protein [Pseudopedobacter saltans]|uniref:VOC family protein n=1 Tax=Pseudopedobacter saltans TaxID=151895 RepID=A0A2W5F8J8_9SPHI|nr:MAG: VOC family protein [Pseudopedobacter saltans]
MAKINVYLNFKGNCEAAFDFYKSVFEKEFTFIGRFKDIPPSEGMPAIPAEVADKIMHVSLPINDGNMLFGSDVVDGFCGDYQYIPGNNISISIDTESKEEADTLFNRLVENGNTTMAIGDTFWGAYFGSLTDQFGINWMINYDYKPNN